MDRNSSTHLNKLYTLQLMILNYMTTHVMSLICQTNSECEHHQDHRRYCEEVDSGYGVCAICPPQLGSCFNNTSCEQGCFTPTPTSETSVSPTTDISDKSNDTHALIPAICVAVSVFILLVLLLVCICAAYQYRRQIRKRRAQNTPFSTPTATTSTATAQHNGIRITKEEHEMQPMARHGVEERQEGAAEAQNNGAQNGVLAPLLAIPQQQQNGMPSIEWERQVSEEKKDSAYWCN